MRLGVGQSQDKSDLEVKIILCAARWVRKRTADLVSTGLDSSFPARANLSKTLFIYE